MQLYRTGNEACIKKLRNEARASLTNEICLQYPSYDPAKIASFRFELHGSMRACRRIITSSFATKIDLNGDRVIRLQQARLSVKLKSLSVESKVTKLYCKHNFQDILIKL